MATDVFDGAASAGQTSGRQPAAGALPNALSRRRSSSRFAGASQRTGDGHAAEDSRGHGTRDVACHRHADSSQRCWSPNQGMAASASAARRTDGGSATAAQAKEWAAPPPPPRTHRVCRSSGAQAAAGRGSRPGGASLPRVGQPDDR